MNLYHSQHDAAAREAEGLRLMRAVNSPSPSNYDGEQVLASGERSSSISGIGIQYRHNRGQVYTSIRPIAHRMADQPLRLARIRPQGKSPRRGFGGRADRAPEWLKACVKGDVDRLEVLEQHPVLDTLMNPGGPFSDFHLRYLAAFSVELTGWGYWWMPVKDGRRQVWYVPAHWVTPEHKGKAFSGWKLKPASHIKEIYIPGEEIAPFWYPDPADPLNSLSTLEAHGEEILAHESLVRAQKMAFENGIFPGLAVIVGDTDAGSGKKFRPRLSRKSRDTIRARINARLRGVGRMNEAVILDRMISDIKPITNKPSEMDFLGSTKMSEGRVARGIGTNPTITGENDGVNFAQAKTADAVFCKYTVNPKIGMMSRSLTSFVLPTLMGDAARGEYVLYIDECEIDDPQYKLETWRLGLQYGSVTLDDFNTNVLKLPSNPKLQVYMRPMGLVETPADGDHGRDPSSGQPAGNDSDGQDDDEPEASRARKQICSKGVLRAKATPTQICDRGGNMASRFVCDVHGKTRSQICGMAGDVASVRRSSFVSAWEKQHGKREQDMRKAVLAFYQGMAKSLGNAVRTVSLEGSPEEIAARVLNKKKWRDELLKAVDSPLTRCYYIGAALELAPFGIGRKPTLPNNSPPAAEEVGKAGYQNLGMDMPASVVSGIGKAIANLKKQSYWQDIFETTTNKLSSIISDSLEDGLVREDLADEIQSTVEDMSDSQAMLIARTETTGALNGGQEEARNHLVDEGIIEEKEWMATFDMVTRQDHADTNGQRVPNDEEFELPDGSKAPYPGHPSLPAKQRCNCRCVATAVTMFSDDDFSDDGKSHNREKAFCPTGPGGGIDPTCSPDTGGSSGGGSGGTYHSHGVDISSWKGSNPTAVYNKNKIAKMEALANAGDIDGLMKMKPGPYKKPNSYNKKVMEAHANLVKSVTVGKAATVHQAATPAEQKSGVVNMDGWEQTGKQAGSNPGGKFKAADGTEYYAKFPSNPAMARNEVLAAKLYELAGVNVAQYTLVEKDGKLGSASKFEQSAKSADWNNSEHRELAQDAFAAHAWLANWDAIGDPSQPDNVRMIDGKAVAMDVGGSLEFRAQGEPKGEQFGDTANEWDTLRDPSIAPAASKVFSEMTPSQLSQSAAKLGDITSTQIKELVDKYHGGTQAEKDQLSKKLTLRLDDITQKGLEAADASWTTGPELELDLGDQGDAGPEQSEQAKSEKIAPALPPPPGGFSNFSNAQMSDMYEAAKAGNLEALNAIVTIPDALTTSQQVKHQYKQDLLAALKQGGVAHPNHEGAATIAAEAASKVVTPTIDHSQFPETPEFVSKNQEQVAANKALVDVALNHAKAGNLDALQAMELPPSQKLKSWHSQLTHNLATQLNPPPKAESASGLAGQAAAKAIKLNKGDKIGYWIVAGSGEAAAAAIPQTDVKPDWGTGKAAWEGLSATQKNAVKAYTGGKYDSINTSLRADAKPSSAALTAARGVMKASVPLSEGSVLWRKHDIDKSAVPALFSSVGQIVRDKAILSTSSDEYAWSGRVHWKLTVGKGVKGVPARKFSNSPSEDEVIFGPNTKILVTKVTEKKQSSWNGSIQAEGIILEFDPKQCCPP